LSDKPGFHRPKHVCSRLRVGHTKLYELIGAGFLDAYKVGSNTVITDESVDRYEKSLPKADIRTGQKAKAAQPPARPV
jgi:excisionase family DNA binding protein